ncbi:MULTISPECIES: hypothetical protein [Kitasatospora]|uniref:Uncharacterized protein n=1 Tax=Kitasatospora setae (strain ATCC 33774 / DSM 43861 / JCM 3304 / KCC A-0304 / NBRC 14216 / KM-6054) TaxID=452652 RepID=E4N0S2_KITSK|nr:MULTISPECIES: hypothetical protein [Kitasatospora]BAJ31756.1 hypothetical protein KSE_59860 [Kitasatospora setae KM-6054]
MSRTAKTKGLIALAVGAAAVVAGVPALAGAATTDAHRAAPPALTIDFTGSNSLAGAANAVGAGFGGTAAAKDASGAQVATVYDQCTKDAVAVDSVTAFCAADLVFTGGDQVTFTAVVPIDNPLTAKYPKQFDGVITGGTGAYQGLTGAVHLTNTAAGVYSLGWDA